MLLVEQENPPRALCTPFINAQLARLATRKQIARTAMLAMLTGAALTASLEWLLR
jgi:hypothetical protein